jgi:hypothetical protein
MKPQRRELRDEAETRLSPVLHFGCGDPLLAIHPRLAENGFNRSLFARSLFANSISAFFVLDVVISALILLRFRGGSTASSQESLARFLVCAPGRRFPRSASLLYLRECQNKARVCSGAL